MTALEWTLTIILITLYITVMVTAGVITLRKGRWFLLVLGIFFPLFWLLGAILPARQGSAYEVDRELEMRPGYPTR